MRVGLGFDVHRLVAGRDLMLGGVKIDHDMGLLGHSDGDALIHAVCDAILGAAGLGDIGMMFPDTDAKYKDVSSVQFLMEVAKRISDAGFRIANIDATVAAEAPRLSPHYVAMRSTMADAMSIDLANVSVKATTTEGLGYTGRSEGIAVWAVALLAKA